MPGQRVFVGLEHQIGVLQSNRWLILTVVMIGAFMSVLDSFIVNVALPTIQASIRASSAELELIIASYSLANAVFLISGGRLGDIFGRKKKSEKN